MRIVLFTIFFSGFCVLGQQKDAMLWTGISTDLDINKNITLEYETQLRFTSNMTQFQQYYSELGASYDIVSGVQTAVAYRYSRKNSGDYFFNESRITADIRYRYKTEFGLYIQPKLKYQFSFDRLKEINGVFPSQKHLIRGSLKLAYKNNNFKLIQPFISGELFYPLSPTSTNDILDTYRYKFGLTFDLPKRHAFQISYMFEHENRSTDNLNHIYCLEYSYSFKGLHKRKKNKD